MRMLVPLLLARPARIWVMSGEVEEDLETGKVRLLLKDEEGVQAVLVVDDAEVCADRPFWPKGARQTSDERMAMIWVSWVW